jgi:transposase
MLRIRKVKTASGKIAVQVVERTGLSQRTKVVKHVGSGSSQNELKKLTSLAQSFVNNQEKTLPLFSEISSFDFVSVSHLKAHKGKHIFAYEFLNHFYQLNGFETLGNNLLKNLSILRVFEPASKLRSLTLLKKYFGFDFTKNSLYKNLSKINNLKTDIEKLAVEYAQKHLSFDLSLVFFDVTTLYFETFKEDKEDFREPGFSKDNKHQPQILVCLVVTKEGYPIASEIFEGNKFEGHTLIPVIEKFKNSRKITGLTVVADAAMVSLDNIQKLLAKSLNYIVGARVSSLPLSLIKEISTCLNRTEGVYFQTETEYGTLICDFSQKRANKNKSDREKQIRKALFQINNPAKTTKRLRFLKQNSKTKLSLNKGLIYKDELLEGIKGYYTNLEEINSQLIVSRYKDLWQVEKAFRIAKSDLLARPIFHSKRQSIQAHILIVFVALCLAKAIELKTGKSIQIVKDEIWDTEDIVIEDTLTGRKFTLRTGEY